MILSVEFAVIALLLRSWMFFIVAAGSAVLFFSLIRWASSAFGQPNGSMGTSNNAHDWIKQFAGFSAGLVFGGFWFYVGLVHGDYWLWSVV